MNDGVFDWNRKIMLFKFYRQATSAAAAVIFVILKQLYRKMTLNKLPQRLSI